MTRIRTPTARYFYPIDCNIQIENFLRNFKPPPGLPSQLRGAVLPHAGWTYCGVVMARTLATVARRMTPHSVIVFGADHTGVAGNAVDVRDRWETPLGPLAIDKCIGAHLGNITINDPDSHDREHSIEVLAPMVKYFWPKALLVPVIVRPDPTAVALGESVAGIIQDLGKEIVLIASSDLTHYGKVYGMTPAGSGQKALDWMNSNDRRMTDRLRALETASILTEAQTNRNACGPGALTALTTALSELGIERGYLVDYRTSHGQQPAMDFQTGVGYAGIVY